jgi:lipopolysaccharide transport system ATP-binding protein
MTHPAIRVEGIGKQYRIGERHAAYGTLRDSLAHALTSPFRRLRRGGSARTAKSREMIWALKNISFEIKPGEMVGIIGRNGSGKSTLLKVLSRITEPTDGEARIRGRVGSLLEVGTGFHPELTGYENIYLNGAILGMKRVEIDRRLDEIVAFAEVSKFVDTPVKHYSSGMYLRLAFAVAAHLEPEILLVDEVLAVGDTNFQKKCLAKMEDVGHQGRTVIFVSHNMPAVTRLCPRTILLEEGRLVCDGPSSQVVSAYLNSGVATSAERLWSEDKAPGSEVVRLRAVRVYTTDGTICATVDIRQSFAVEMEYDVLAPGYVVIPHYSVHNEDGIEVFSAVDNSSNWRGKIRPIGHYVSRSWVPGNLLTEGTIIIGAAISTVNPSIFHLYARDAVAVSIIDSCEGDSSRGDYPGALHGVIRPMLQWETRSSSFLRTQNCDKEDSASSDSTAAAYQGM